jgi:hypothetical protein
LLKGFIEILNRLDETAESSATLKPKCGIAGAFALGTTIITVVGWTGSLFAVLFFPMRRLLCLSTSQSRVSLSA